MSAHTPGPWCSKGWSITGPAAADCHLAKWAIREDAERRGKPMICAVVAREGKGAPAVATVHGESQNEADANARLIAAAPELLEALSLVLDETGRECYCATNYECGRCKARAAIAKATTP